MSPKKVRSAPNATLHRRRLASGSAGEIPAAFAQTPHDLFQAECGSAIESIRVAIQSLCVSVDADPLRPQEISRRFRLNKNLTWKFARVLVAKNTMDAVAMLPGPEGIEIFIRAFEAAGASPVHLTAVRHAIAVFDEIVGRHFGARTELELALDAMRADRNLENSRRLAFRGLSGMVGMHAHARFAIQVVSPRGSSSEFADVAVVAGLARLRHLRPAVALPVFRSIASNPSRNQVVEPLCRTGSSTGATTSNDFLMRSFSSHPFAKVETIERDGRLSVEVTGGSIGKIGESTLCFGSVGRGYFPLMQLVDAEGQIDRVASFVSSISLPVEHFANEVYLHRSILARDSLRASIHSTLGQPLSFDETQHAKTALPIDLKTEVFEAGSLPPALDCIPRHTELLAAAFGAMDAAPEDYMLVRIAMQYPPVPSALWVAWDLPPRAV